MHFNDQMAAKMLSQSVKHIGMALDELLCLEPDSELIRAVIAQAQQALEEFERSYFPIFKDRDPTTNEPTLGEPEPDKPESAELTIGVRPI